MSEKTIVSLQAYRELKKAQREDPAYQAKVNDMDKTELLEEMIRFQEERSLIENMPLSMMIQGQILFTALEENAETEELHILSRSFRRHLEHELEEFLKKGRILSPSRDSQDSQITSSSSNNELK